MRWNLPQPGNAGILERHVGIKAARDGAVDVGLLLFVQQRDGLALGPYRLVQPMRSVIEKAHDGGLFVERRQDRFYTAKLLRIKSQATFNHAC